MKTTEKSRIFFLAWVSLVFCCGIGFVALKVNELATNQSMLVGKIGPQNSTPDPAIMMRLMSSISAIEKLNEKIELLQNRIVGLEGQDVRVNGKGVELAEQKALERKNKSTNTVIATRELSADEELVWQLLLRDVKRLKTAVIGAKLTVVDASVAKKLGMKEPMGVYVDAIARNAPVASSKLRVGDIIIRLEERPVFTYQDIQEVLSAKSANDFVRATVWRSGGASAEVSFALTSRAEQLRKELKE